MKTYGRKVKGPCPCQYCRKDNPKSKKPERHKAKLQIKKALNEANG